MRIFLFDLFCQYANCVYICTVIIYSVPKNKNLNSNFIVYGEKKNKGKQRTPKGFDERFRSIRPGTFQLSLLSSKLGRSQPDPRGGSTAWRKAGGGKRGRSGNPKKGC